MPKSLHKHTLPEVAIITNYLNNNFGSVLQSYALQETLRRLDFCPVNIRWRPDVAEKRSRILNATRHIYRCSAALWSSHHRRAYRFNNFRKSHINETGDAFSNEQALNLLNKRFDAFICGSDQIWAPNQFHERYYLGFVHDDILKIAYAPSIGLPEIPDHLTRRMAELLQRIDFISIREHAGAAIIKKIADRDAEVVLDPTLLIERQDWLRVATGQTSSDDYVLCYFLGGNPNHRRQAESWAKKTGCRLVVVPSGKKACSWGDAYLADTGPGQFIQLIDNARWVLTDSYHGMVFSLLMNKPFLAFMRFPEDDVLCQNSRVHHLLERYRLMQSIVTYHNPVLPKLFKVDYTSINSCIRDDRKRSIAFLRNSLQQKRAVADTSGGKC